MNQKSSVVQILKSVPQVLTSDTLLPNQLQRLAKRGALGIGRTGSPGGHYSGDIMLAFSTANDIGMPRMMADDHPLFNTMQSLGDHYIETVYEAAVDAVEEAILNALVAADDTPLIKPAGLVWKAIDHNRLSAIMKRYGR